MYPVIALRGLAVYPGLRVPLQIGRAQSLRAVSAAVAGDGRVLLCAQHDPRCDAPGASDLYEMGTIAILREVQPDSGGAQGDDEGGTVRVVAEGLARARLRDLRVGETAREPGPGCLLARADILVEEDGSADPEIAELARALLQRYERWKAAGGRVLAEAVLPPVAAPGRLCDSIAANVLHRPEDRQRVLEAVGLRERLDGVHRMLIRETEQNRVERDVANRVRRQMDRTQREYYLREQLKAIQKELGDIDGPQGEAMELRGRLEAAGLPTVPKERAERELDRLEKMPPMAAEASVTRTYLEWILALPWTRLAEEDTDLRRAERVLDEDHHGLQRAKERVLEYLALRQLRGSRPRGPVLCMLGPPGAGKTSLARSVARALGRPFVRMSLGGVRDEAEIRGHRRTYVGALPGRILHGLRQAGARNPVFLLDEVDKTSSDYRGDPAAALLEVLDPEQNHAFSDHYLELPFDLSQVLFITTANSLAPLTRPLLDRLEVITLQGYGPDDKLRIARKHLLPRLVGESGLSAQALHVTDGAIADIIDRYTREAGVRGLDRELAAICRKAAREVVRRPAARLQVTRRNLPTYLGKPRIFRQGLPERAEVGTAAALAWTESGGDLLVLEASVLPGRGGLQLTGKLGEVMRESAHAALSYLRARSAEFGLPEDFPRRCELHVHAPEGGVPKEGPSAGVALATALVSVLTGTPVLADIAMTGEITLRGRVLPVGGVQEKVMAARRAGASRVVLPAANRVDWDELCETCSPGIEPIFVDRIGQVFAVALRGGCPRPEAVARTAPALLFARAAEAEDKGAPAVPRSSPLVGDLSAGAVTSSEPPPPSGRPRL